MTPADRPSDPETSLRLLVIQPDRPPELRRFADLPLLLAPADLVVVNDAATVPASLAGRLGGAPVEVRLAARVDGRRWSAVTFGAGTWRDRTEDRPAPPPLPVGARVDFDGFCAVVEAVAPVSPRLVTLAFDRDGDALWDAIYRVGRPIQYSHLREPVDLWSVQTAYAERPWAVEMPSAGRGLTLARLAQLRGIGVRVATLTHAAGLSATGDEALDHALPLPERYAIPDGTVEAIRDARAAGGRIVAVGTTVVRALEGSAARHGELVAEEAVTALRIGPRFSPRVVDAVISGLHPPEETHHALLRAFATEAGLRAGLELATRAGLHSHEFGDACLVVGRATRSRGPINATRRRATGESGARPVPAAENSGHDRSSDRARRAASR
jgi:S-adenosylmethionine:tRNA ribosyltransferase-isomerase